MNKNYKYGRVNIISRYLNFYFPMNSLFPDYSNFMFKVRLSRLEWGETGFDS